MPLILLSLILVFGIIMAQVVARKARLPIELILLVGSLIISIVPGIPRVTLAPELVFYIFLPPILFAAAFFTSWRDFVQNKRPIALLAVGLVIFTTVATAGVLKLLVPELPWAVAFLIGAVVSPPDASAATAITKQFKVPRRLITVIEGESLVNDATALVAFRLALAGVAVPEWSLGATVLDFGSVALGGAIVGFLIAKVSMEILKRLLEPNAETLLTLLTAFVAYTAAELVHVSGVISTVVAGLYFGRNLPRYGSAELRIGAKAVWDAVLLGINGAVFTLIGLQLPLVISQLEDRGHGKQFCVALLVSAAVILVRFLWVFPATYLPRKLFRSVRDRDPSPPWPVVVLLGWIGMRGIVSLAAALSVPLVLADGRPFPYRNLVIFVTYTVILVTLVLPTITLPWLMRRLPLDGGQESEKDEALARVEMTRAGLKELERLKFNSTSPVLGRWLDTYRTHLSVLEPNLLENAFSPIVPGERENRRIALQALRSERSELEQLRIHGRIHDEVFHHLIEELDREELRYRGSNRALL